MRFHLRHEIDERLAAVGRLRARREREVTELRRAERQIERE